MTIKKIMSLETWQKEKSPQMAFVQMMNYCFPNDKTLFDALNSLVNEAQRKYSSALVYSQSEPFHISWWGDDIAHNESENNIKKFWIISFFGRKSGRGFDSEPIRKLSEKTTEQLIHLLPPEWSSFDDEWLFKESVYVAKGEHSLSRGLYSEEQIKLFILELYDKEKEKYEKLRNNYIKSEKRLTTYERPRIPESIRIEVWRRDGGKCAKCGNRESLEFDPLVIT